MDDPVWECQYILQEPGSLAQKEGGEEVFPGSVEAAQERNLLSDEHFTVDGALIEAWARLKSFQRKEKEKQENGDEEKDRGNANVNFRGEKRSNQTHESKTNPDAKLARKGDGKEAKLSYNGNLLVGNRNGLIMDATVLEATVCRPSRRAAKREDSGLRVPSRQRTGFHADPGRLMANT